MRVVRESRANTTSCRNVSFTGAEFCNTERYIRAALKHTQQGSMNVAQFYGGIEALQIENNKVSSRYVRCGIRDVGPPFDRTVYVAGNQNPRKEIKESLVHSAQYRPRYLRQPLPPVFRQHWLPPLEHGHSDVSARIRSVD